MMLSPTEIHETVEDLGRMISKDFDGSNPIVVCVLRGAAIFFADLVREISVPHEHDFIRVTSYVGTESKGEPILAHGADDQRWQDRSILFVEDIVDTGRTARFLIMYAHWNGAKSAEICTLLSKPERREVEVPIAYIGRSIPDRFVVGYGMDHNESCRSLPYIKEWDDLGATD